MINTSYSQFLEQKRIVAAPVGFDVPETALNDKLFVWQKAIVRWALRRGRAAIFSRYGTGKTAMQLEWARHVSEHTGHAVLILAPLAVAQQTKREGEKFGIAVNICRTQKDVTEGVNITNYEMLPHFDPSVFGAIVLDESSILKSYDGKTRTQIIEAFEDTPYRLACTATPAPNDHMELGNHNEFMGIMTRSEMLSMFFVHDGGDTSQWRLKGHAEKDFWQWLCSWAVMLRKPSDIGYDDTGYDLPPLTIHQIEIAVEHQEQAASGSQLYLFPVEALSLIDRRNARKVSLQDRIQAVVDLVNQSHNLHLTGKYGKLATCGNQNTQQNDAKNTTLTRKSAKNDALKAVLQRKTKNTCENTIKQTKNDGTNTESPISKNATASEESDTQTILNFESNAKLNLDNATKTRNATEDYDPILASAQQNMMQFSQAKTDVAQYADPNMETAENDGSISITAIQPELSEDFSVQTVISDLGASETILIPSQQQSNTSNDQDKPEAWIIWCNLNAEQDALEKAFGNRAFSVHGSLAPDEKVRQLLAWIDGDRPIMISKPSVLGFGINMQHCHKAAYVGLSDSFEELDQSVHRIHRFGQQHACDVYIITSELEGAVVRNIERKREDHTRMTDNMIAHMSDLNTQALHGGAAKETAEYVTNSTTGNGWTAILGDCVDSVAAMADDSIDYSIFSPPFASLYTYSNSERDMGNCQGTDEFYQHFIFLVKHLYRTLKPGRLLSFHCMNLPSSKTHDGYIGIKDFRGELIRMFVECGFIYHSEVVIWKDPVTAMQRTKAIGLLHKQFKKDSCMSRQGIPDYLVTMRKPGVNPDPVAGPLTYYAGEDVLPEAPNDERKSIEIWQRYASPVWFDINPSKTLQYTSAREQADEKHIAPLQLEVVERALQLWTNPNDLVLTPFMGIGTEAVVSIRMGRRAIGVELKPSYYRQAVANLRIAEQTKDSPTLFDLMEADTQERGYADMLADGEDE